MALKGLKFPEQAISEIEQLQSIARKLLSDEKNIDIFDEIFPIFKNNSAVVCCAILEFIDKWDQVQANMSPAKIRERRSQIIKLLRRVRRKGWLSEEVRGYNLT